MLERCSRRCEIETFREIDEITQIDRLDSDCAWGLACDASMSGWAVVSQDNDLSLWIGKASACCLASLFLVVGSIEANPFQLCGGRAEIDTPAHLKILPHVEEPATEGFGFRVPPSPRRLQFANHRKASANSSIPIGRLIAAPTKDRLQWVAEDYRSECLGGMANQLMLRNANSDSIRPGIPI